MAGTIVQILGNFEETLKDFGFECVSDGAGSTEYKIDKDLTDLEMVELAKVLAERHIRIFKDTTLEEMEGME